MEMIKTSIKHVNPETKEVQENTFESEAVCAVFVNGKGEGRVEVTQSIIGQLNLDTTRAVVGGLLKSCNEILKGVDPVLAKLILMSELENSLLKDGEEDVAGTSDEPERPSEQ